MTATRNPWKTLSSRNVYDNDWIRLTEHDVVNPSGGPGLYGKVHFRNIACGIIPLDDNAQTWLVGQYRYTLDRYSWEIPMGGVPRDQVLADGARRELKEETGLSARRWQQILSVDVSNSITDEAGVVFVAEGLTEGEPEFDETEDLQVRRLPFADALEMAMTGEITDLLSVAGIFKLARLRSF